MTKQYGCLLPVRAGAILATFGIGAVISKPLLGWTRDLIGPRAGKILPVACLLCFSVLLLLFGKCSTEAGFSPDCAYSWGCGLWLYAAVVCPADGSIGDQGRGRRFRIHECSVAAWRYACPARRWRGLWQRALPLGWLIDTLAVGPFCAAIVLCFLRPVHETSQMECSQLPRSSTSQVARRLRHPCGRVIVRDLPRRGRLKNRIEIVFHALHHRRPRFLRIASNVRRQHHVIERRQCRWRSPARSRKHQGPRPRCAYSPDDQSKHLDRPPSHAKH